MMLDVEFLRSPPGEIRGFLHKRLLRGALGLVTGGPTAALAGFVAPTTRPAGPVLTDAQRFALKSPAQQEAANRARFLARGGGGGQAAQDMGAQIKFADAALPTSIFGIDVPCIFPFRKDPRSGECRLFAGTQTGVDDTPVGDAVMGRFGAALAPGSRVVDRAVCLRGMVLGVDGLCYNRSSIRNSDRMWPRGRAPLLTGGQMRAISIAATAGRKLERTTKRLQKIGLMKKPARRAAPRIALPAHQHQITSGD